MGVPTLFDISVSRQIRRTAVRCVLVLALGTVSACGGGGGGSAPAPLPPANSPPTLLGDLSPTFSENQIVSFFLSVDDPEGDTVTITVGNSSDGQFFTLDTGSGEIRSTQAFDFEMPLDSNTDNVYEQLVTLDDGTTSVNRTVRVTITNAEEPPTCVPVPETAVDENTTGTLATLIGTDPDAGDEAIAVFEDLMVSDMRLDGSLAIDPTTGEVTLTSPLDAEAFAADFSFMVTANYRTNGLFDRCSVTVALNDLPTRVTSGVLLTDNKAQLEPLTDLNGGGVDDFWLADESDAVAAGEIVGSLVFGETLSAEVLANGAATIDVDALSATQALRITVAFNRGGGNATVASALPIADLDGDGDDDLLILTNQPPNDGLDPTRRPWGYVVYAATIAGNATGSLDLNTLAPTDGLSLTGPVDFNGTSAGYAVADVDGVVGDELVIGLPDSLSFSSEEGTLYVVNGTALAAASGNLDFDLEPSTRTFVGPIIPDPSFTVGPPTIVSDLSGDGINELVLQSRRAVAIVPSANLVGSLGGSIETLNPLLLDLGGDVAGVVDSGDLDADTTSDLLIVRGGGAAGTEQASVVFGAALQPIVASNSTVTVDDTSFGAGQYVAVTSTGIGDLSEPVTLTRIGDLDGDGRDEVAFGLLNDAGNTPGSIYIVRGATLSGLAGTSFDVDTFSGTDGTRISPVPFLFNSLSTQLALAPDIDGDGLPELYVVSNQRLQADPPGLGAIVLSTDVSAALAAEQLEIDMAALFFDETPVNP